MVVRRELICNSNLMEKIIMAIRSIKRYKYRSAPGLAEQTGIHLEHLEHYLLDLAQRGVLTIGHDGEGTIWVQLGK